MYLLTVLLKDEKYLVKNLVEIENSDKNATLQTQLYKHIDINKK